MRRFLSAVLCLSLLAASAPAQPKYVALTFDDGPSGRYTQALLEGLDQRNVKATFFLCGYRLRLYPQMAQRICQAGHEIGCHGDSHKSMLTMGHRELAAEITGTLALLPPGTDVRFLRPPGGQWNTAVTQVAEAKQLAVITWSVDPEDWATADAALVRKRVTSAVKDGDVVLLHDMSDSSVMAALAIVDELQAKGFQFVTLSRLAALRECRLHPGQVYTCFPPH